MPVRIPYQVPLYFVAIHTALVFLVGLAVWTNPDGESGMAWYLFFIIDWPMSLVLMRPKDEVTFVVCLIVGGGVWWGGISLIVQLFIDTYRANRA